MLASGKIIASPQPILIDGVNYSKNIFRKWTIERLLGLGIRHFQEERFDRRWFKSIGTTDTVQSDEAIIRTHILEPRYADDIARFEMINQVRSQYIALTQKAASHEDFYNVVGDSENKKIWGDYIIALKDDAKLLRDSVNDAGTYEEIINLRFSFTQSPGASEPGPE
jgi:hypothetical protein